MPEEGQLSVQLELQIQSILRCTAVTPEHLLGMHCASVSIQQVGK